MSKSVMDDEIDLFDLFRRIGRTISKWFAALGRGLLIILLFLFRNFLILTLSVLVGVGLSYVLKWSTKPFYNAEIIFRSNAVPNAEMIAYLNRLHLLLKEKNFDAISGSLSLPKEKALAIRDLQAFWVIDRKNDKIPDYIDYRNRHNVYDTVNVRMQDRLVIRARISDPGNFGLLRDGIQSYINSNNSFRQRNEFRLKTTDELLARLNYDIIQLDSLQKIKYFEETKNLQPKNGGQIVFLQEQKTQLVYEDIYNLYNRKQSLDEEKEVFPGIVTLITDFYQPVRRHNGGFYYGKIVIPSLFALTLIYLIVIRNRKKLKEIYRKY